MAPYLTICAVGSNAGYGGDFIARMQAWADNLYKLARQYALDAELVVVEWNPPEDRFSIYDAIEWHSTIPTRIITVPRKYHESLANPHGEKFFEYAAKNVGIRRAAGRFILSTNPDNIYSPSLIHRLAKHDLDEGCFYRTNRYDVRDGKVITVNFAHGSVIDWELQSNPNTAVPDSDGMVDYPGLGKLPILHFNAAGDFILMARQAWEKIKGHPEVPYSLTVDGQTVYLAAKAGLKQVILPWMMFHTDHGRTPKYYEPWSDLTPHGKNNTTWGFEGVDFDERRI